jgi:hypothetical protein
MGGKMWLIGDEVEGEARLTVKDGSVAVRLSSWVIRYLQGLAQLQKDWLLIYGIY